MQFQTEPMATSDVIYSDYSLLDRSTIRPGCLNSTDEPTSFHDLQDILSSTASVYYCNPVYRFGNFISGLSLAEQIVEGAILSFDIIVGLIGNMFVLLTLYYDRRFRRRSESAYYIAFVLLDLVLLLLVLPTFLATIILKRSTINTTFAIIISILLVTHYFLKNAFNMALSINRLFCVCFNRRTYSYVCTIQSSIVIFVIFGLIHGLAIILLALIIGKRTLSVVFIPSLGIHLIHELLSSFIMFWYLIISYFVFFLIALIFYMIIFIVLTVAATKLIGKRTSFNHFVKTKLKPCLITSTIFYVTTLPIAVVALLQLFPTVAIPTIALRLAFVVSFFSASVNPYMYALCIQEYRTCFSAFLSFRSPVEVQQEQRKRRLLAKPWLTREKSMRTTQGAANVQEFSSEPAPGFPSLKDSFHATSANVELSVQVLVSLQDALRQGSTPAPTLSQDQVEIGSPGKDDSAKQSCHSNNEEAQREVGNDMNQEPYSEIADN